MSSGGGISTSITPTQLLNQLNASTLSKLNQAQVQAAVAAALAGYSTLNQAQVQQAVENALIAQDVAGVTSAVLGLGGGGGGSSFPTTVVVSSGSYTVPGGFNARVSLTPKNGETFTIDANSIFETQAQDIALVHIKDSAAAAVNISVNASRYFLGQFSIANNAAFTGHFYSGLSGVSDTSVYIGASDAANQFSSLTKGHNIVLGPNGYGSFGIQSGANGGQNKNIDGVEIGKQNTQAAVSFMCPPGTILAGTAKKLIELYPI